MFELHKTCQIFRCFVFRHATHTCTIHNTIFTVINPNYLDTRKNMVRGTKLLKGWLVVLRLNVPVNNFSVMSGRSHRFLGN